MFHHPQPAYDANAGSGDDSGLTKMVTNIKQPLAA